MVRTGDCTIWFDGKELTQIVSFYFSGTRQFFFFVGSQIILFFNSLSAFLGFLLKPALMNLAIHFRIYNCLALAQFYLFDKALFGIHILVVLKSHNNS